MYLNVIYCKLYYSFIFIFIFYEINFILICILEFLFFIGFL